jgi:PKD repeat protein
MKKRWISVLVATLAGTVALFLCLTWAAGQAAAETAVAAPPHTIPVSPDSVEAETLKPAANRAAGGWEVECVDCPPPPHQFTDMTDRSLKLDAAGHPHIAYGENYLYYAWHDGADWHYETVDDSPDVGAAASLVVDGDGYPHISYYDDANDALKYAYRDGSGWHIQTVDTDVHSYAGLDISLALDGGQYPHISYSNSFDSFFTTDLRYAYLNGSGWHTETVDSGNVGKYNSLALDEDGHPHIVYDDDAEGYTDTDASLRYAYHDGSSWVTRTVESTGDYSPIGRDNSLALEPTAPYTPHVSYVNSTGDRKYAYLDGSAWHTQTLAFKGWFSSLVLDESGYPRFSYSDNGLLFAYMDGSGWHTQTVRSGADFRYTSLVLGGDGYAHISYYDNTTKDLEYAYRDAADWHFRTVDSESDGGNEVGEHTSLALDENGYAHVSYYDDTDGDLKYAYQDGSGWYTLTVDSGGDVGQYTSLALDGDGYPHISYYDDSGDDLKYAYQDASGWHSQTVDSDGRVGTYTSLALEPTAPYTPHISYYDASNEHPKYAYLGGSGWYSQTVGTGFPAGQYTSLALGSDGYPQISYYCHYFGDLRHTRQVTATGWQESVVAYYSENFNRAGRFNSLALDDSGYPYISYYDEFLGALRVAKDWAPNGWSTMWTVDSVAAWDTSLVMSGTYPHVSYYDALHLDLKYAYRDASGWTSQTIDSDGDVGRYTSLAMDGDGHPHISYYDADRHHLKYAYLSTRPIAGFTADPTSGFRPLTVAFADTSTGAEVDTWLWSFGDGGTSSQQSPTHTYETAGTYTVSLAISGPGGTDALTRSNYISVYEPVKADFYGTPVQGTFPLDVSFTDASSGPVEVWEWDFGDSETSGQQHPTHRYTTTGVFTVTLTVRVTGASALLPGGTDTHTRTAYITVTEPAPQVDFVGAPRSGPAPLTVQFTSTVTGTVSAYAWDFGDDGVASSPHPSHTYRSAGSFGVSLLVTGPGGTAEESKPGYVTVNAPPGVPTATFSADVVSGTAPLTVTFTAVTSGTVEHWLWSFGDSGTAFTGPVVGHTYVTTGVFDVSLTVSNTHGSFVVSQPSYITVSEKGEDWYPVYLPAVMRM